jgi:hypothetical protein
MDHIAIAKLLIDKGASLEAKDKVCSWHQVEECIGIVCIKHLNGTDQQASKSELDSFCGGAQSGYASSVMGARC